MLFVLMILLVLAILFAPGWWAGYILAWHAGERQDFPGTGGELARHLLDKNGLEAVAVEESDSIDHYCPLNKAVRLTRDRLNGKSLTAVAVAAHEVGHALQDAAGNPVLSSRVRLGQMDAVIQKWGRILCYVLLGAGIILRVPMFAGMALALIVIGWLVSVIMHLFSLPLEWDASFRHALPMLEQGNYLHPDDLSAVRRILTACALTYVASAISSLLSIRRWF